MFGDIPSGWAFGRMGRPAMRRPNPYSGLVDGLSAGELEADLVPVVHADLRSGPARVQLFVRTPGLLIVSVDRWAYMRFRFGANSVESEALGRLQMFGVPRPLASVCASTRSRPSHTLG